VCCSVYHYFLIIFFALLSIQFCSYCYSTFLITMSLNILHSIEVHKTLCYIKMYLLDIKQNVCAALFALISYYVFCSWYTLNVVISQSTCTKFHWWIFHLFRLNDFAFVIFHDVSVILLCRGIVAVCIFLCYVSGTLYVCMLLWLQIHNHSHNCSCVSTDM
jgi:hypothetical protein